MPKEKKDDNSAKRWLQVVAVAIVVSAGVGVAVGILLNRAVKNSKKVKPKLNAKSSSKASLSKGAQSKPKNKEQKQCPTKGMSPSGRNRALSPVISAPLPVDLENFKSAMHAFMSLISMEKTGCELLPVSDPGCYQCLTEDFDPGWEPEQFHRFFQNMSSGAGTDRLSDKAAQLIGKWKRHSQRCVDFFSRKDHVSLIQSLFGETEVVIYPWGADRHRVYIELLKKEIGCYRIRIFDLGAGRAFQRSHYKPIEFDNLTQLQFDEKILQFNENYGKPLSLELLLKVFDTKEAECIDCVPEYAQKTGNCVVKNFLAAMQQDAVDCYSVNDGLAVFSELYIWLLDTCLCEAEKNASKYLITELPSFETLHQLIETNQNAFTGTSK